MIPHPSIPLHKTSKDPFRHSLLGEKCRKYLLLRGRSRSLYEFADRNKAEEVRPLPFAGRTEPNASLSVREYGKRIDEWFHNIQKQFETYSIGPGDGGITVDATSGEILKKSSQGQGALTTLQTGWHIREIEGKPYSEQRLAVYASADSCYTLRVEKHVPTSVQLEVLRKVRDRVLTEFRLMKEGCDLPQLDAERLAFEEPVRGLIHGLPGSGKSALILFIRSFFEKALQWEYGVDFIFVAFQNRVAYAMGGETLHTAGYLDIGNRPRISHTDVDILFTRNRHLKWVLVDEVGMISDLLLGAFEMSLTDASDREPRYKMRRKVERRLFGGYNVLTFGDFSQLSPLPPGGPIFVPPTASTGSKQERARSMKDVFWEDNEAALNYFIELVETKRYDDRWYATVLDECRAGALSEENYAFLHGLPTANPGSWSPSSGQAECGNPFCATLAKEWENQPYTCWEEQVRRECEVCCAERARRHRLLTPQDSEAQQDAFIEAPYIHQNNEPKYHAMLLRAREYAKRYKIHCLWFQAVDRIHDSTQKRKDPAQLNLQRQRFLQFHDQRTAGIPGLSPLFIGLKMRVAEKIRRSKKIIVLKHTSCTVVGWRLHELDQQHVDQGDGERFLDYLPEFIAVYFDDVDWQVEGFPPGVLPIFPEKHDWVFNKETDAKAERHGFRLIPDFASTAFMMQGTSLRAALVECGSVDAPGSFASMINAYVILSRVKRANGLALLRAFSPELFNTGVAPGPHCLIKRRRHIASSGNANRAYSVEDAHEEYTYRMGKTTGRIKYITQCGLPLQCHGCKHRCTPDAYKPFASRSPPADQPDSARSRAAQDVKRHGATSHAPPEVPTGMDSLLYGPDDAYDDATTGDDSWTETRLLEYWKQGCRRRCYECNVLQSMPADMKTHVCKSCQQHFPPVGKKDEVCRSCNRWRQQQEHCCEKCRKNKAWGEVHFLHNEFTGEASDTVRGIGRVICKACAPDLTQLRCVICDTEKLALDFPVAERKEKMCELRRCWKCFACKVCGKKHADKKGFYPGTPYCWKCNKVSCEVCSEEKKASDFSDSQLTINRQRNTHLRCRACHTCRTCHQETIAKDFDECATECRACMARGLHRTCERCGHVRESQEFVAENINKSSKSSRTDPLVCLPCREEGYTPQAMTAYRCAQCGPKGHNKFTNSDLTAYWNEMRTKKSAALLCVDCQKTYARCNACEKWLRHEDEGWGKVEIMHHRVHCTTLVCRACRETGATKRDKTLHSCEACKKKLHRASFDGKK